MGKYYRALVKKASGRARILGGVVLFLLATLLAFAPASQAVASLGAGPVGGRTSDALGSVTRAANPSLDGRTVGNTIRVLPQVRTAAADVTAPQVTDPLAPTGTILPVNGTPIPSDTPEATATPRYTSTPEPTSTTVPTDTTTPAPTEVPGSPTPVPSESPSPPATPSPSPTPTQTPRGRLEVTIDPPSGSVLPGLTTSFTVHVVNTVMVTDTAQITYANSDAVGFSYSQPVASLSLAPGETKDFSYSVTAGPQAVAYSAETTVITVRLSSAPAVFGEDTATTTVQAVRGFTLSADSTDGQTERRKPITYTLTLQNTGNITETVNLDRSREVTQFTSVIWEPGVSKPESGKGPVTLVITPYATLDLRLAVTPSRPISKPFSNKIAKPPYVDNPEDLAIFEIITRPWDLTEVTARAGDLGDSVSIKTTVKPLPDLLPQQPAPPADAQEKRLRSLADSWHDIPKTLDSAPTDRELAMLGSEQQVGVMSQEAVNPHQKSSLTCAYCHEVHGAPDNSTPNINNKLLKASGNDRYSKGDTSTVVRALCDTCHDGSGSKYLSEAGLVNGTNTLGGGTKQENASSPFIVGGKYTYSTYTANGKTVDYVPAGAVTTTISISATQSVSSAHQIEANVAPGFSTRSADNFVCTKCHDPHGPDNGNPRLIPQTVTFGGGSAPVTFNWTYQTSTTPEKVTPTSGSTQFCMACHNDTNALRHNGGHGGSTYSFPVSMSVDNVYPNFSLPVASGGIGGGIAPTDRVPAEWDGTSLYRVMVCLTCHKAHGSSKEPTAGSSSLPLGRPEFSDYEVASGFGWCTACHGVF